MLAGAAFHTVGMPEIAEDDPPSVESLREFAEDGRAWVYECDDRVVAYLLVEMVGGNAHVAQVSVDPKWRGNRLGAALIDHVGEWARERGIAAVTLTTFRNVPWNAPYYRRIGFQEVPAGGPLAAVVALEARLGLDPNQRVCMRRKVSPAR